MYYAQGAGCLARALRANDTLTELDLRWNELGNDGARAIRDSLDVNRRLTSVKVSGNKARLQRWWMSVANIAVPQHYTVMAHLALPLLDYW